MIVAECISVGTELLLGEIVDTNASAVGQVFADLGVNQYRRSTVGDNLDRLVLTLRESLNRADLVLLIGGLGPTQDDLTRRAVAIVLEDDLVLDEEWSKRLKSIFETRGLKMTNNQMGQAMRLSKGELIPNENGTAPGFVGYMGSKVVVCLPGPPNEFLPMLNGWVRNKLESMNDSHRLYRRTLRVVGIGEGALEDQLQDLLHDETVTLAPYAKLGEVHLRLATYSDQEQKALADLERMASEIYVRLGKHVYAEGETGIAEWLVNRLKERAETVGTIESCTSGLVGAAFTAVDGASEVFAGGLSVYTAEQKVNLVGVDPQTVRDPESGTVSQKMAEELAVKGRLRLGTTYAISVTGVAGSAELKENGVTKPSGLVYIGIATAEGVTVNKLRLRGDRATIRNRAVAVALQMLRDLIIQVEKQELE